jgi:hypothetical protein
VQRRFKQLCAFLADNSEMFEVVPISRFATSANSPERALFLDGNVTSSVRRAAENFVNDRLPLRAR